MRSLKCFTILIATLLTLVSAAKAEYFTDIIVTSPDGLWTDARAYSTLADAIAAVGTDNRVIVISSEETVTNLTIPSNVQLHFVKEGSINNSGILILETRNITAGDHQIFTGSGAINFAKGSELRSTWFANFPTAAIATFDEAVVLIISKDEIVNISCAIGDNVVLKWNSPNTLSAASGVTVSNIGNIDAGSYQIFTGTGDFDFRPGSVLKSSWFPSLSSADTLTDDDNVDLTIEVDRPETVGLDMTFDAYQSVKVNKGCPITISTGITLTQEGLFEAGLYQVFNCIGTGKVIFGSGSVKEVYPQWWGAKGDGATDDTLSIQAAVSSANNSGGLIVFFPKSTYCISAPINLKSYSYGNRLLGSGNFSEIKAIASISSVILFDDTMSHNFTSIKDIRINGDGKANYGIYGEYNGGVSGVSHCLIENNRIQGTLVEAIHLEYGWCNDILYNTIINNTGGGMYFHNSANMLNIVGNKVLSSGGVGITLNGGYGATISGNTIEANTKGGLSIRAFASPSVIGNYFESNGHNVANENYAIRLGPGGVAVTGGVIKSNNITGGSITGLCGVLFSSGSELEITNNYFSGLTYAFDLSTYAHGSAMYSCLIRDNYTEVTTIWNPTVDYYEGKFAQYNNRIVIPGIFEEGNGNLLTRHPIDWDLLMTGGSTITMLTYPSFTMENVPVEDGQCYATLKLDTSVGGKYEYLRGKYISFGIRVKSDSSSYIRISAHDVANESNIDTSFVNKVITVQVPSTSTVLSLVLANFTGGSTITISDIWFTLGTSQPSEQISKISSRTGSGSPVGVKVPMFIGEEYYDTTGHWYKAHGLTDADWTALN